MNPRILAALGAAFVAGAVGLWIWSSGGGEPPAPEGSETPDVAVATPPPPTTGGADPGRSDPGSVANVPTGSVPLPVATPAPTPARITSSVVPGMPVARSTPKPNAPPAPAPAGRPAPRPVAEPEARAQVESVSFMFRDFRTRMGENPVGTNAEIMKAVMGGNPAKARLGPPEGQGLNDQGELVDRWGTAYFFHQMAKDKMEIRSAGPDRQMWTTDDVVAQ